MQPKAEAGNLPKPCPKMKIDKTDPHPRPNSFVIQSPRLPQPENITLPGIDHSLKTFELAGHGNAKFVLANEVAVLFDYRDAERLLRSVKFKNVFTEIKTTEAETTQLRERGILSNKCKRDSISLFKAQSVSDWYRSRTDRPFREITLSGTSHTLKTFKLAGHEDVEFVLAIDVARLAGYTRSDILFRKDSSSMLTRVMTTESQTADLVHQNVLKPSQASCISVTVIEAQSVIKWYQETTLDSTKLPSLRLMILDALETMNDPDGSKSKEICNWIKEYTIAMKS